MFNYISYEGDSREMKDGIYPDLKKQTCPKKYIVFIQTKGLK